MQSTNCFTQPFRIEHWQRKQLVLGRRQWFVMHSITLRLKHSAQPDVKPKWFAWQLATQA